MGRQERMRKRNSKIQLRYRRPHNWHRLEERWSPSLSLPRRGDLDLLGEIRHIQQLAAAFDARIITQGELAFFSTDTGDAWMLDTADHLAMRLAKGGAPLPVPIEDTDTRFVVGCPGIYRIEGHDFVYTEAMKDYARETRIVGYPVETILEQIQRNRSQETSLDETEE